MALHEKVAQVAALYGGARPLARRLGVAPATVWRWMHVVKGRGRRSHPSAEQLLRLMVLARKPVGWWLDGEGAGEVPPVTVSASEYELFLKAVDRFRRACRKPRSR